VILLRGQVAAPSGLRVLTSPVEVTRGRFAGWYSVLSGPAGPAGSGSSPDQVVAAFAAANRAQGWDVQVGARGDGQSAHLTGSRGVRPDGAQPGAGWELVVDAARVAVDQPVLVRVLVTEPATSQTDKS
jgi:hypothetical protein